MKLDQSFEVAAPADAVWAALIDVQRVAPCLPGAELTAGDDEGTYQGTFSVKLGPTSASYRGTLKLEEVDEAARRATMRANGTDKARPGRGEGAHRLDRPRGRRRHDGRRRQHGLLDHRPSGRLRRGGMIQDVANRLLREFASCLQETLGAEPAAAGAPAAAGPDAAGDADGVATPAAATVAADAPGVTVPPPPPGATGPARTASAAPPPTAKPISGGALILGVLRDRVVRLVARLREQVRARRRRG
jgi:carbon monoxide dehydrogenase subunit G